jgi:DNA uptake protein ComE-like DNA-binding protein
MTDIARSVRIVTTAALATVLAGSAACTYHPTQEEKDQRIRDQSAQATRDLKQGAKNAVHDLGQVAQGVKQGLESKNGNGGTSGSAGESDRVDINSASEARLALLPGVSFSQAQAIVKGRPYRDTRSLVTDGVLTRAQYERIADSITAK